MILTSLSDRFKKIDWRLFLSIFGLLITVILIWAPFGWKTTDTIEGWLNLYRAETDPLIPHFGFARVFVILPWEWAYFISPNSFIGAQIVLASLIFAKALLLFLIQRELKIVDYVTAFFIGALFIIYPADEGVFALRALGRHAGVFFYILAVYFLVLALRKSNPIFLIMMILAEGFSLLTSEAGIPLMFFTPLIFLFWRDRFSKQKRIQVAITWFITPILYTFWFVYGFLFTTLLAYQTRRFNSGYGGSSSFVGEVLRSNLLAYYRGFLEGWLNSFSLLNSETRFILISLIITLIICGIAWTIYHFTDNSVETEDKPVVFFQPLLIGLIIFGLGFLPYSVTNLRYDRWRVFYYSVIGSTLVFGIIYFYLSRLALNWPKGIFVALWAPIIFLATLSSVNQKNSYVNMSNLQEIALSTMSEQAPYIKPKTEIVILVKKEGTGPFPGVDAFPYAIHWLYQSMDLDGAICYASRKDCIFGDNMLTVKNPSIYATSNEYPYSTVLFFRYKPGRGLVLLKEIPDELLINNSNSGYQPYDRITAYIPFPKRPQEAFDEKYAPNPAHVSPKGWVGKYLTMDDRRVCDDAYSGKCSLLISGNGVPTIFNQEIGVQGKVGDTLTLKLCIKSSLIHEQYDDQTTSFAMLTTSNVDGSSVKYKLPISQKSAEWECVEQVFTSEQPYTHLAISLINGTDTLNLWIDNLHLFKNSTEIAIRNESFED